MSELEVKLTAEEVGYILGMLKEHLGYYRLLDSAKHRSRAAMLEGLRAKLTRVKASTGDGLAK